MKKSILFGALALLAGPLFAADSSPKDDVTNAARKLGDSANYSWHATVVVPEDSQFRPGPTDGKTEKEYAAWVTRDGWRKVSSDKWVILFPEEVGQEHWKGAHPPLAKW